MISGTALPFAYASILLSIPSLVLGQTLDKALINPAIDFSQIDQGLLNNLTPAQSTVDQWGAGWIPQDCKTITEGAGFKATDIEVFNVHYTDCPDVWIMCRHNQSPMSQNDMIDLWGRVPVHMRSYVRHLVALPGQRSAGSNGDNIAFNGPANVISIFVHETGHSLDSHAYPQDLLPFHSSAPWLQAFDQDSSISDPYARTSQSENVAQETVISLFDKVVPGGLGTIEPSWNAIFHQYATLQANLGQTLLPGGTCSGRLANSPPVPMTSASRRIRTAMAPKPDVSLSDAVSVIPAIPMSAEYHVTFWNDEHQATGVEKKNVKA